MKLYVGITDYDWFRYLKAQQPGGSRRCCDSAAEVR